jgi:endogenous inhibitor of DNA gyrase (YacG/DUF329 family)
MEIKHCEVCGKPISTEGKDKYRYSISRFCSRACYQVDHSEKYEIVPCPICEKPFKRNSRITSKKMFCSTHCQYAATVNIGHIYKGVNGYLYIKVGPSKYELLHRLMLQYKLGRKLKDGESSHHINGDKLDNRTENLCVFDSNSSHVNYHNRLWNGKHPKDSPEAIRRRSCTRGERFYKDKTSTPKCPKCGHTARYIPPHRKPYQWKCNNIECEFQFVSEIRGWTEKKQIGSCTK